MVDIKTLETDAFLEITESQSRDDLESIGKKYLGKDGLLQNILKTLKDLPPDQKKIVGQGANILKKTLEIELQKQHTIFFEKEIEAKLGDQWLDTTLPGSSSQKGSLHPLSLVQYEIEDIFTELGFSVVDGPEVENDWYNFDALNIPKDHPARDMWDTFFLEGDHILRTHTSAVQMRVMEQQEPPFRIIAPGRCYRNESVDANHEHSLHQIEGVWVDKNITIAHMKQVFELFLSRIFKHAITVRLRPAFFPFVTPGMEVDFLCQICNGEGCSACKQAGWIEFLGCGMMHPKVLENANVDPEVYQGFAFGFGLDRLIMMKYGISDIRLLQDNDLRFLKQFS
jgi:phenylalanyl-tRNA synthetase alpha chain